MNVVKLNQHDIAPSKIVCIGRNYVAHIEELQNEVPEQVIIFIKPNSAIASAPCASSSEPIHYEGEISFMVKAGKLHAVGFGLDLTKRQLQSALKAKGLPWERAKAFDRSAVFSEFMHYAGQLQDLRMELYLNGKLQQQAGYDLMLHKPDALLHEIQSFLTLEDGDIIMTGTPKGVGPINTGDTLLGRIFENERLLVEASWTVQ